MREVDGSALKNNSNVVRFLTGREISGIASASKLMPPGAKAYWNSIETHALAIDKVRYVGEPVAAVLCESAEAREDAIDSVRVDYGALPAVEPVRKALN